MAEVFSSNSLDYFVTEGTEEQKPFRVFISCRACGKPLILQ